VAIQTIPPYGIYATPEGYADRMEGPCGRRGFGVPDRAAPAPRGAARLLLASCLYAFRPPALSARRAVFVCPSRPAVGVSFVPCPYAFRPMLTAPRARASRLRTGVRRAGNPPLLGTAGAFCTPFTRIPCVSPQSDQ